MTNQKNLLDKMKNGEPLCLYEQITMIVKLSIPAILAQISSIVMQYIDASMVGQIGADDSASIGLVSSSTWMFGGLCMALSTGFTVQIAQKIGAKREQEARSTVKTGLVCAVVFGLFLLVVGAMISQPLPYWLGGDAFICPKASIYFLVYALAIPIMLLNSIASGMLQCSGNMKLPGMLHIVMCILDVIFNAILIFPSRTVDIFGLRFLMWGAGLGITGAALGTALAELVIAVLMLYFLLVRSESLHLRKEEHFAFSWSDVRRMFQIGIPVAVEQIVTCGAYIAFTAIVAPLGTIAIAANSFSITAESFCYMPGYGIGAAATTIIGQSIGAKRKDLTGRLGWLLTLSGILMMTLTGALMYLIAPQMIGLLSPDPAIRELGTAILRIEVFAEPMYAASIVASGVFRGAGDTVVPSILNFISMWLVRIPLAWFLSTDYGLQGVWFAMCVELCVRGVLFLILLGTRFKKRTAKWEGE